MNSAAILIVDDEETGLHVRKLVLEAEGYKVLTAKSGEEALRVLDRNSVDAIITDQIMPGMDGVQVAREVKRQQPELPVIMLSALHAAPTNVGNAIDRFVVKGQSPSVLLSTLESLLPVETHSHEDFDGEYVAFVDRDRKYIDVTDGVCDLLGYSREDLLGMRIDDVAAPAEAANVVPLFQRYVAEKGQDGAFILQGRGGKLIPIL
jgi:CheY-like chemotaxis protein